MSMNTVIQERRKALGLTQEQVADSLGVSTPAVSKWEKGITSPDIGLLPALARLLKIDLNTLFCFREDLSPQEISLFCNEIAAAGQKDIGAAFALAEEKCREFPHSEELLLNAVILLDAMLLSADVSEQEKGILEEKVENWYSRLSQSSDGKICNSANYLRVNRYIRQDKLDMAQQVLDAIQDKEELSRALPDKHMLQVLIHLKQNKADLAALELERELYLAVNRVQLLMARLVDAELAAGEKTVADTIAEKARELTEVLDLWKYTGYMPAFQMASTEKNAEKTMELLSRMLESLTLTWDLSSSSLFYRMSSEMKNVEGRQILSMIVKALENDPECAYLRENEKFSVLLEKYRRAEREAERAKE